MPGVYLQAHLGALGLAPVGLPDADLSVEVYLPSEFPLDPAGVAYPPMRAYTGTLRMSGGTLSFTALHVSSLQDEIVLKGSFQADHDADHASALKQLLGGAEVTRFLPAEIAKVVDTFQLAELGLCVVGKEGGGYRLASTHLGIAFRHDPDDRWPPLPGFKCQVFFERLDLVAVHPEGAGSPQFFCTARAGAKLLGSEFDVAVRVPGFFVSLEQTGPPITTDAFFEACFPQGTPRPPSLQIDRLSVTIDPGSYYAMSVSIKPGASWSAVEGKPAFPDVRLTATSTGWELNARTGVEGHGVPVFDLVNRLVELVGMEPLTIPPVLHALTVEALCLTRSGRGDFLLELEGSLDLDVGSACTQVRTKLHVSVSRSSGTTGAKEFGGQIILTQESEAPLEFDLAVASDGDAPMFLAGFHDDAGLHVRVRQLLEALPVPDAVRAGPASDIDLALHDALFVFEKRVGQPNRLLLALDIEGGSSCPPRGCPACR